MAQFRFILLNERKKAGGYQLICDDKIKPVETVEAGEIEPAERE